MFNRFTFGFFPLVGLTIVTTLMPCQSSAKDRGAAQFELCKRCHGSAGQGRKELAAPAIAGLPEWYIQTQLHNFAGGIRGAHPKNLPGTRMRPMARTLKVSGDLEAVAAYVSKLPVADNKKTVHEGSAFKGQQTYNVCIACHGVKGEGNKALGAPPIGQINDWYALTQLQHFKSGIRGTHPNDQWGPTMRAIASTLSDDDMKNVVAYVQLLGQQQDMAKAQ